MTGNCSLVTGATVGSPATTLIKSGANFTGNWVVVGNNDLGIMKTAANITATNNVIVGGIQRPQALLQWLLGTNRQYYCECRCPSHRGFQRIVRLIFVERRNDKCRQDLSKLALTIMVF